MSKEAAWLLRELPVLVGKGVVDEAAAARLRAHYAAAPEGLSWGLVLLAIGGAGLIGLGIILLFAHNWEHWTPELRVALSLAPLLLGQLACLRALRGDSRLWSEAAGLFTALAAGASIALIAQTYQFGGDLPRFVLTWTLLALPLIYLLDSSAVAALCWLGTLAWALVTSDGIGWERSESLRQALRLPSFLLLAVLPLPHLLRHVRLDRGSARVSWLLRVSLTVLALGYAASTGWVDSGNIVLVYAAMSAAALLAGRLWFSGVQGLWGNPLAGAGLLGVCAIALLGTLQEAWEGMKFVLEGRLLFAGLLAAAAAGMAWRLWRQSHDPLAPVAAALPLLLVLMELLNPVPGIVLGHLYVLALVAVLIRAGFSEARLDLANLGAGLAASVVLLRFFDSDLSYVVRGVGFIVTGIGFFVAVLWLRRRLQGQAV